MALILLLSALVGISALAAVLIGIMVYVLSLVIGL